MRDIATFLARRLAVMLALLVVTSFVVFLLLYLAPGSPELALLGPRQSTPATLAAIRAEYHLNDSFFQQYLLWLGHAVRFDFGRSIRTNDLVTTDIGSHLAISLQLAGMAFAIAMLLGVPLGILAAIKQRSATGGTIVALGIFGVSAPAFAIGVLLLYVCGYKLGLFPIYGIGEGFPGRAQHLILPALALALTQMGYIIVLTRAAMSEALGRDYIVFAEARGLSQRKIVFAYGLRNALVPIVTGGGLILPVMLGAAILVERTFAIPGVGSLLVDSVSFKDVPAVQGITLVIAMFVVVVNIAVDLAYLAIDPRIRLGHAPT